MRESHIGNSTRVPSGERSESPVLGTDGESRLGNSERVPSRERRESPVLGTDRESRQGHNEKIPCCTDNGHQMESTLCVIAERIATLRRSDWCASCGSKDSVGRLPLEHCSQRLMLQLDGIRASHRFGRRQMLTQVVGFVAQASMIFNHKRCHNAVRVFGTFVSGCHSCGGSISARRPVIESFPCQGTDDCQVD